MSATQKRSMMLAVLAAVIVVATIVSSVRIMGSPARQRLIRLDQKRIHDLSMIAMHIDMYWSQRHVLPKTLSDIPMASAFDFSMKDPRTDSLYRYIPGADSSYQLCATFATDAQASDIWLPRYLPTSPATGWAHRHGENCFPMVPDLPGMQMTARSISL